ncbi:MAG: hypothetical protein IKA61_04190 [Clostridia bacterium]|nr:hypothetical protein [Clostridia bacterium]
MNKRLKKNIFTAGLLALVVSFNVGCNKPGTQSGGDKPVNYTYSKDSAELLHFESSDKDLDFFLNDYFKRHSGVIEDGLDQKVASVTAGVNAVQFFWQEWNSMSYYWHNSRDGFETDRIEGIRKIHSNIPVDDYGYVWQESDAVRPNNSTTQSGEHRMGWPFPTSINVVGSTSWDFNGTSVENPWSSSFIKGGEAHFNADAGLYNGLLQTDVSEVESLEFISPENDYSCAYYAPLLELDVRMYTEDPESIDDIIVHYTTNRCHEWQSVSVNEKAFISYEYTPSYEHLIFLPMYAEETWASDKECEIYVNQIRVEIKAKEGRTLSGRFGLNYVRSSFDTRHSNNNSIFISSLRNDYDFTGDLNYLKENITKARKAINFYMQMYDEERCLNDQSYLVGHDSDKTSRDKSDRTAMTLANGYWDVSFMTKYDFESNVYFYKALVDLAYLEGILAKNGITVDKSLATVKTADRQYNHGISEYTYTASSLNEIAGKVLTELRKSTNDSDKTGYWSEETGRFVGGYCEAEDKWYDYGYVMWNLEAIYYGVATDAQAKSIMDWISGKRIVEADKYGSQGEDIYFFELGPRVNTYSDENQNDLSIFNGSFNDPNCYFGETQIQNGGAVLYLTFFDLMARVDTYGADDAYDRLLAVKDWYMDIYDYYVASDNYNKNPDRFYWDYYENGQWENSNNKKYLLQNGVKGTLERGGRTAGAIGVDGEFLESFLVMSAIPYGFFGIDAENGNTLKIAPSLPSQLSYWGMENLAYNGVKYDLTVFKNSIRIDSVRGNSNGIRVQVSLDAPSASPTVLVNGRQTSEFTVKDGKVIVTVPLKSTTVEVK